MMNPSRRICPTKDRLLVEVDRRERKVGSIVLPAHSQEKLDLVVSKVLGLGPDVKAKKWELWEGDYVLTVRAILLRYDGTLGRVGKGENSELAFIYEKDILAVLDPGLVVTGAGQYDEGKTGTWSQ